MLLFQLLLAVLLTSPSLAHVIKRSPGPGVCGPPTATISSGPIVGTTTSVPGASCNKVYQFLGVQFAQSPPTRFLPPEAAPSWTAPVFTTEKKPSCVQSYFNPVEKQAFNNPGFPAPPESEDCLYMNIYVPACDPPEGGYPVMTWIYGGNLDIGSTYVSFYDGTSFAANQGVIVAVPAYRTNVLGFPNAPQIAMEDQNAGFLDQRFALEWVRTNIAAFGGNPERNTIFGESAGAFSIQELLALPPDPLPFHAAILESPAVIHTGVYPSNWEVISQYVGCGNVSTAAQFECMSTISVDTLRNASQALELQFGQVNNNITSSALSGNAQFLTGSFANVPFLVGTNLQEGRVFATILGFGANSTENDIYLFLDKYLPAPNPILIGEIMALYPTPLYGSPYHVISAILTDAAFTCTTSLYSNTAAASGFKNWRYQFEVAFPNLDFTFPDPGVSHTTEIPEVWGTYFTDGATEQQIELSKYMQTIWANFAKDPAAGLPWPNVGNPLAAGFDLGALGLDGSYGETTIDRNYVDRGCQVLGPLFTAFGI